MIHFIIGTKAQFIKMIPLMWELQRRQARYKVINLSQHGDLTEDILKDFSIRPDTLHLGTRGKSVTSVTEALKWALGILRLAVKRRDALRAQLFPDDKHPVALVHGDTLSTLLGAVLSKRAGVPLGLVEAGLTSHRWHSPFPEEMIRRTVERFSQFLFAPGALPAERLRRHYPHRAVIDTDYNTGRDALYLALEGHTNTDQMPAYVVLTLHRFETITNRKRLNSLMQYIMELSQWLPPIQFYLHKPTEEALLRTGWLDRLRTSAKIQLHPLVSYGRFANILAGAQAIVADGGSIQEEAFSLGKPCIIIRDETERMDGLGNTARLRSDVPKNDALFLLSSSTKPRPEYAFMQASQRIIDRLTESGFLNGR